MQDFNLDQFSEYLHSKQIAILPQEAEDIYSLLSLLAETGIDDLLETKDAKNIQG